ncbi:MAG: TonB-dependent receptor [Bacteroidia bacterium]|nr:TonB-dependent receptor [Bacteroidia bacterium]
MNKVPFFLLLVLWLPFSLRAQYTLSGTVLDEVSNAPLSRATVVLQGTRTGVLTGQDGSFVLSGLPAGKGMVLIRYNGYEPDSFVFDMGGGRTLLKTFFLRPTTYSLGEVEIAGRLEGEYKALNDQRLANNIKNVISAAQMIKFPDLNAAESISRIPGVTLQRDQGEGRYVQLRGTPPELSNFSINGEQIPSPEGGVRYVALDVVPVDQLSSIEIYKALTPDLDGDAIGGAINLITKMAKDTVPEIHAALATGYNHLSEKLQYNGQFAFGQRYKKFGFYVNASLLRDQRYSHNMEFDFNESRFGGDTTFRIHYDDIQLRHYDITRQRIGLSGTWDFKPSDRHGFVLNMLYNQYSDDEIRRRVRYNIGSGFLTSETSAREAQIERDVRDRLKIQTVSSINFSGKHVWDGWKLDYMGSFSLANEKVPDRMDINFVNDLVNIGIDLTEPTYPRITFPRARDSATVFKYTDYKFDEMLLQNTLTTDENLTARWNLERTYAAGVHRGSIKIGAKVRMKEKQRDNQGRVYHKYYQVFAVNSPFDSIRQIYNSVGPELTLATLAGGFDDLNMLDRGFALGATPDPGQSLDFVDYYFQHFKLEESDTKEESHAEDFTAFEDIYAAYGMATHYWGKWMALAGLRYELTRIDYLGYDVQFKAFSDAFERIDTLRSGRDYAFLLPQFHLKYSPDNRTNFRAAATWTYSRPNFEDILPYRQSELDSRQITLGNPDLDFARSINLDLLVETYRNRGGLLSGGVFFKQIDNFVYYFEQRIYVENISRPGWYFVTTAQNGLRASVQGAEFSLNQQFYRLPGFWQYFGVYANYTFTHSRATIRARDGQPETISLPGQAPHAANLALFFDSPRWYLKLSANYNASFLDQLGIKKTWDIYYAQNLHLDFNLIYKVNTHLELYLNTVNLTNTPLRYYIGEETRIKQHEFYSWWARGGVRLHFRP